MRRRVLGWVGALLLLGGLGLPGARAEGPERIRVWARGERGGVDYGAGHAPALARYVEAGELSRASLRAAMAPGIGRFLQQVRVEARLLNGRFSGWRVLALFPSRPDVRIPVLRPGDIVLRVNGRPIERPEQFKAVWDALAQAQHLDLDIERAGHRSRLRYRILGSAALAGGR